ncbi:MAG: thioredoxin family protein, partial [Rhodospirillales bacterium]
MDISMQTRSARRRFIATFCALAALGAAFPARAKAKLGEDGLYQMDWYVESFLELADDFAAAARRGKRFAVLWGLRGCPACRRMHEVHFADPAIAGYVRENFDIVHLNILGAREVTDFEGTRLPEKSFAERYGVRGTPTIQFFPETLDGLEQRPPAKREVARL